jgi:hypothetical protein
VKGERGGWGTLRIVNVVVAYVLLAIIFVGMFSPERDYASDTFGVLLAVAMLRDWFTPFESSGLSRGD